MAKQIDVWTGTDGGEILILDHGDLVEVCSLHGMALLLTENDARRVYAALEQWLAALPSEITSDILPAGVAPDGG